MRNQTMAGIDEFLYVTGDGSIRDSNIEHMFDDCFYGRELDDIFRTNFREYTRLIAGPDYIPPKDVFDNVIKLLEWATPVFGPITVSPAPAATVAGTKSLREAGATHRAAFDQPTRFKVNPCYAPSELHAVFLCLVSAYRKTASEHVERTFAKAPSQMRH